MVSVVWEISVKSISDIYIQKPTTGSISGPSVVVGVVVVCVVVVCVVVVGVVVVSVVVVVVVLVVVVGASALKTSCTQGFSSSVPL